MVQQTELSKVARDYNSLLWQLKGSIGSITRLKYSLPQQGLLLAAPNTSDPARARNKLVAALATAVDHLEYCEYLLRQLSESHRAALKYTDKLTKEDKEVH